MDAGIRQQPGLEVRKVDNFSGSGRAIRWAGGAQGLRNDV